AKESHSARALSEIDFLLREAGVKVSEINLFASSTGPGSFTGLRIGLAMIKSFAATLERPCYGVSTLAALARGAGPREGGVVAILPAGRGELFAQTFRVGFGREVRTLDDPVHLRPEALWERMLARSEPLFWCGPGVHLYSAQICDYAARKGVHCTVMDEGLNQVSDGWVISPARTVIACEVGALAAAAKKDQWLKAEELSALYVRRADPELKAESQKAIQLEQTITRAG
ncbi:MAG TPA: tRNA (adenosine(37)-N6)-threonylcarbamoyltransferase complex dimerization subunit type 1 TsaB, partial [Pyrinomonadaceae bacterium]|nr:tRNA (adenosine(37)-N6)-threonylcarbamoyltransferase complex dimerization subunit type 1 TsaB [Pyrinomonadaceae bacterium]